MAGRIPRLEFDELRPDLAEVLASRVQRLGYLGEFFRVAGHQPSALKGFVEFTESAKSGLDKRLVELLALTVATHYENAYERNQHERLAVRLGYGREWVNAVEQLDPEGAPGLTELERSVQAFALASVQSHGRGAHSTFNGLVSVLGVESSVAMLLVISRYVAHAYMVHTLELEPPVPSIWDDGFDG